MTIITKTDPIVSISQVERRGIKFRIVGTTPLYLNAMSEKVRQELLVGGRKKTAADKIKVKHNPIEEFRASAYIQEEGLTKLGFPMVGLKAAMCDAALETPGITKSSIQRLVWVPDGLANIYGIPRLKMDVVRSADMKRTPDVRTRCFIPHWGAEIEVAYVSPNIDALSVVALLNNAGVMIGIGDFRQQKGKGSYGSFRVLGDGDQDEEWDELEHQGRLAQEAAMLHPECADLETQKLFDFCEEEIARRAA